MDHRPDTIDQRRLPASQGGAPAAPGRLSPEPARDATLPVGPSEALEVVADALNARGLGRPLAPRQAKEKRGTTELRLRPPPGARRNDARFRAARGIASSGAQPTWAPCVQGVPPDGRLGRVGAWWITAGAAAGWRDEPGTKGRSGNRRGEVLDLHPGWARPPAEATA